jgi:hypothetical protein
MLRYYGSNGGHGGPPHGTMVGGTGAAGTGMAGRDARPTDTGATWLRR